MNYWKKTFQICASYLSFSSTKRPLFKYSSLAKFRAQFLIIFKKYGENILPIIIQLLQQKQLSRSKYHVIFEINLVGLHLLLQCKVCLITQY